MFSSLRLDYGRSAQLYGHYRDYGHYGHYGHYRHYHLYSPYGRYSHYATTASAVDPVVCGCIYIVSKGTCDNTDLDIYLHTYSSKVVYIYVTTRSADS